MRGKPFQVRCERDPERLIPARAGKTPSPRQCPATSSAHPRACGENRPHPRAGALPSGSSPRVRGKLSDALGLDPYGRLIPARAGKTLVLRKRKAGSRAHPRACGENPEPQAVPGDLIGSSPRVRGKRVGAGDGHLGVGLIPARAGKTGRSGPRRRAWRAHPRVCGENWCPCRQRAGHRGSSPRVRGKPGELSAGDAKPRLIPACAGKTTGTGCTARARGAHPRVCGENVTRVPDMFPFPGSSPRVRGKLHGLAGNCGDGGLIPACAGKTSGPPRASSPGRAHPRVCGENLEGAGEGVDGLGSSPRVRGKLAGVRHRRVRQGLIPARAGKTASMNAVTTGSRAHPRVCGENARGGQGLSR